MAILSSKRQITLPKELCDQANIRPGELQHLKARADVSESASRDHALLQGTD
jgi:bifunctional DNA-binding transcriptional regulator/antitoxin component of YhaV-PrlF toxin-antitoxin module